jgi:putative FmdB family regulatory protein
MWTSFCQHISPEGGGTQFLDNIGLKLISRGHETMPIYEYLCEDCGSKFEKLVRNGDAVACPSCGEQHLSPQLSVFAAKTGVSKKTSSDDMPACPGGMCQNPGMCGMN